MKPVSVMDKMIALEEMLTKLGYATDTITVDQMLDLKNGIEGFLKVIGLELIQG